MKINLLTNLPAELTTVLQEGNGVRIERIISTGHRSTDGFWFDQDENEWVMASDLPSRRIALSSSASANSRFSRLFSFSRSFSRLAKVYPEATVLLLLFTSTSAPSHRSS